MKTSSKSHIQQIADCGNVKHREDFGSRMVYTARFHCHPVNFWIHFFTLPLQLLAFWVLPSIWLLPLTLATTKWTIVAICAIYYSSIEGLVAAILCIQTFLIFTIAQVIHLAEDQTRAAYAMGFSLLTMLIMQLFVGHHGFQGGNAAFEAFDEFVVLPFYLWAQVLRWFGYGSFAEELGVPSPPMHAEDAPDDDPAQWKDTSFRNWCGAGRVESATMYFPARLAHLVTIVNRARETSKKIRIVGKGHSFTKAITCCDEKQIMVRNSLLRGISVNLEAKTATVQAGVTVGELDHVLSKFGLCVPTNIIATGMTWAGIVSTASHGAGYSPMCNWVESLTLVDGNGEIKTFSRNKDRAAFSAAVVSLGLCGLIFDLTINVQEMRILQSRDVTVNEALSTEFLLRKARSLDQFEVFANGDRVYCREWKRVDEPPRIIDYAIKNFISKAVLFVAGRLSCFIISIHYFTGYNLITYCFGMFAPFMARTTYAPDCYHYMPRMGDAPMYSTEFCVNVEDVPRALKIAERLQKDFVSQGKNPMYFFSEVRLTPRGSASTFLMPGSSLGDSKWMAWVEVIGVDADQRIITFAQAWAKEMVKAFPHAVPHWGKGFDVLPKNILKQVIHRNYGERLIAFETERKKLDPTGIFLNKYLHNLLSPLSVCDKEILLDESKEILLDENNECVDKRCIDADKTSIVFSAAVA